MIKRFTFLVSMLAALPVLAQQETAAPVNLSEAEVALVTFAQSNDCSVPKNVLDQLIAGEVAQAFAGPLAEAGVSRLAESGELIILPPFCGEVSTPPSDKMAALLGIFAAHNCSMGTRGKNAIPETRLMQMFAEAGLGQEELFALVDTLVESGQAEEVVDIDGITVLPPLCMPVAPATDALTLAVIDVFVQNGCAVNNAEVMSLFPNAGLAIEDVQPIVFELIEQGTIRQEAGGQFVLSADYCGSEPAKLDISGPVLPALNDLQEQYVYIMSRNDCRVKISQILSIFGEFGMEPAGMAYELEESLTDHNILHGYNDGLDIGIGPDYCTPASSFGNLHAYELRPVERDVVEMLEHHHCRIKASQIAEIFPAAVYDIAEIEGAFAQMLGSGIAQVTVGNDIISISPEKCLPWSARG